MAKFIQTVEFMVEVPDELLEDPDEEGDGFTMDIPMELIRVDDINKPGGAVPGARVTEYTTTDVSRVQEAHAMTAGEEE